MKFTAPLVAILNFAAGLTVAAAVVSKDAPTLIPRNRILGGLRNIWNDAYNCRTQNPSYIAGCFQQETTFNIQNIKVDGNQSFVPWKADLLYDFNYLREGYQVQLQQFEQNYQTFKSRVYALMTFYAKNGYYNARLANWDLRYHLALVWEAAAYLDQDIRNDLYSSLEKQSYLLHVQLGAHYTEYPRSVSAVLVQLETVFDFYYPPGDLSYNQAFMPIHQSIFKYVSSAQAAGFMEDAGGGGDLGPIGSTSVKNWMGVITLNLKASVAIAFHTLPELRKSKGYIVFLATTFSQTRLADLSAYNVGKLTLIRLAECIHIENADAGVKAFAVHPGLIITDLTSWIVDSDPAQKAVFCDPPELSALTEVRLVAGQEDWLSGRFVDATWNLDEITKRKDAIFQDDALKLRLALLTSAA